MKAYWFGEKPQSGEVKFFYDKIDALKHFFDENAWNWKSILKDFKSIKTEKAEFYFKVDLEIVIKKRLFMPPQYNENYKFICNKCIPNQEYLDKLEEKMRILDSLILSKSYRNDRFFHSLILLKSYRNDKFFHLYPQNFNFKSWSDLYQKLQKNLYGNNLIEIKTYDKIYKFYEINLMLRECE